MHNCAVAGNPIGTAVKLVTGASMSIEDSIVFFNNADGLQVEGSPSIVYSDIQGGFQGEGNISFNPIFCKFGLIQTDIVIVAGSPCIDTGNPDPTRDDACFPP